MDNKLALTDIYGVEELKGVPVVSSRKIAEIFNKEHKNVLSAIQNCKCSNEFSQLNFKPSNYTERGKKYPEYLLTKDGFAFVVMGFNGKKAAQFKETYINRFNQMEEFIKDLIVAKAEFPEFTDAIMSAHEEPKHYHFTNELDMINSIVLGMSAKKFKEINGLGKVQSIRPYVQPEQMKYIRTLQRADIGMIITVPEYAERKRILTEYFNRISLKQIGA